MQSEPIPAAATESAPVAARPLSVRKNGWAVAWFGVLPVLGLASELASGILSPGFGLFATWWHVIAVIAAVGLNCWLHAACGRPVRSLPMRALGTAFVAGMAMLYATALAPALPLIVVGLLIWGLGLLAAAPYFTCLGLWRLFADLRKRWRCAGRGAPELLVCITIGLAPAVWLALVSRRPGLDHATTVLGRLHHAMEAAAPAADVEALAAAVRAGDVELQREICTFGDQVWNDDVSWVDSHGRFDHLANGKEFWFHRNPARLRLAQATRGVRIAFHRAHGEAWDHRPPRTARNGWDGGASIAWQASRFTITAEPAAAIARVDWEIEVAATAFSPVEARFDVQLPGGAVVSSLSSWIQGEERPAAFADHRAVTAAYDDVVAKQRDPVLLRERVPGHVQMLLFPLTRGLPPMRVRVGVTVPLRWIGERAELGLPRVIDHNCFAAAVTQHSVSFTGEGMPPMRLVPVLERHQPIELPRVMQTVHTRDADGVVVQRLVPRSRVALPPAFVIVLEASASMATAPLRAEELLAAFPAGVPCVLFVAHGDAFVQCDAATGSAQLPTFVRAQPCTGGVDASAAMRAAIVTAKQRGTSRVFWLHGAAPTRHFTEELAAVDADIEIATLALGAGRHVGVEQLAKSRLVEIARHGDDAAALVAALTDFIAFAVLGDDDETGDHARSYERVAAPPADSIEVSDQIARLCAARQARAALRAGDAAAAAKLAARFRVATAGVAAVVLETQADYLQHGLDPGARIGREPEGPAGGSPVPEPATIVLLGSGLLVVAWRQRRRRRCATPSA